MLMVPKHIHEAGITTRVLLYPWDEWNVRSHYMFEDADQFTRLDGLTDKANTALAIATGEWICERFKTLDDDPRPLQFLEAAWAAVVHSAYCEFTVTDDDEWRGPVRAPLALTISIINDALFCLNDNPDLAFRSCWMFNLAKHVLPDTTIFEEWFEACVKRLEAFHDVARDVSEEEEDLFAEYPWQGSSIPREAFEPDFSYQPDLAPQLLDRFLKALRPDQNPYLRTAQEIEDLGGVGQIPYTYAINSDG